MGEMLENLKRDMEQTVNSTLGLPINTAKAGVEMLAGENPLPKIKESAKQSAWDIFALGPRVIRDISLGIAKGTLKFTWNLIKLIPLPLPTLTAWKNERDVQKTRTQEALAVLREKTPPMRLEKETYRQTA